MFTSVNPTTGEVGPQWSPLDRSALDRRVAESWLAWQVWRDFSYGQRAIHVRRVADRLVARRDDFAAMMAREMGKPMEQGRAEIDACVELCRYYATHTGEFLVDEPVKTEARHAWVRCEPLGVVLAIHPFNHPFWQLFRFAAPALMAGNSMLFKPSRNTVGCATAMAELFPASGAPEGLVNVLPIELSDVERVIADRRVAGVTFVGGEEAGAEVAALAGRHLKKCVMELGGSDPFIVLADADLDRAARAGALSRTLNCGQSSFSAKRFIIVRSVADAFLARLEAELRGLVVGDPMLPGTQVGPLARADLRARVHRQVAKTVALGADLRMGGVVPQGPGFFYPVTLLVGVRQGMPAWDEEVFGPVAAVRIVSGQDEAIEAANQTRFGMGATVFTGDRMRANELAARIEAGVVYVNEQLQVDHRLPFGGTKGSGYGRELSWHGLREFVNTKAVWMV